MCVLEVGKDNITFLLPGFHFLLTQTSAGEKQQKRYKWPELTSRRPETVKARHFLSFLCFLMLQD
jgi:hypothetical protein